MGAINIKDIAKICGVGVSTVSRAINSHPDINLETKKMILDTIKEHGYVPNNSARNLKRTNSNTIAILVKGITNPFFFNLLKILEQEVQKKKYSIILQRVDENKDEVDVALELVKERRLKGIVILGGYLTHDREKISMIDVPTVLVTTTVSSDIQGTYCSWVSVDDIAESKKMVNYLCKKGHKKILILCAGKKDESIGKLRLEGYRRGLEENGIIPDENLIMHTEESVETHTMKNGYELTKLALEQKLDFSAIFAISDTIAIGACKALLEAGKKIPKDVSVAGFDGLEITNYYTPSITTIRQPVEDMAYAASKILFRMIGDKTRSKQEHMIFSAELVVGDSTR